MLCNVAQQFLPKPSVRRRTPAARRVRPGLEALEDRTAPTVAFRPQVAGEAVINDGSQNTALNSASVYLLFEGAYWGSAAGALDEATITADALKILSSPYLSGLSQYTPSRGNVQATFGGTYQDTAPLPADFARPSTDDGAFDWSVLNARLQAAFADPVGGVPASAAPTPIYVMLTDPNVPSGAGGGGYNDSTSATDHRHQVWTTVDLSGPPGAFDEDQFTRLLSHELAESMSGSVKVNLPAAYASFGDQIADGEPESGRGYGYRLNGVLVQAYWSEQDQAFIVPDGNRQVFTLDAITAGPSGHPSYSLSVRGDQLGTAYDDRVLIDSGASGGVRVALNGEVVQFDAGVIFSIMVNTGRGLDRVRVALTAPGPGVTFTRKGPARVKFVQRGGRVLNTSSPIFWEGGGAGRTNPILLFYDPWKGLRVRKVLSNRDDKFKTRDSVAGSGSANAGPHRAGAGDGTFGYTLEIILSPAAAIAAHL